METLDHIFENLVRNHAAHIWGALVGVITYLVEPTAAFVALWIAVAMDLVSRVIAQASKYGGYWKATKNGHIQSKKMLTGTAIKIVAYFFMTVLAYQSKYIVSIDAVPVLFSCIVYGILFWVEVQSIAENFLDAGVEEFRPLLIRIKREKDQMVGPILPLPTQKPAQPLNEITPESPRRENGEP